MQRETVSPVARADHGVGFEYIAALIGAKNTTRILSAFFEPKTGGEINDRRIDYITAWKILNASVESSGDESHRLIQDGVPVGNFELLMASMLQGDNLLDGLRRMAAGAKILRPDLSIIVSVYSGRPHLSIGFASPPTLAKEIYLEALTVVLHCAVQWALAKPLRPERVRGSSAIDPRHGSLLAILSPVVKREGSGVTVVYAGADGQADFQVRSFSRWHDATFAEYQKFVDQAVGASASELDETIRRVRMLLLEGVNSQTAVGRRLGMSVPTLRRRLADGGTTFRALVGSVRRDAAEVLLLGDKSVEDIAAELGLSDSRCFRRACHAWFGGAPSDVRRVIRAEAAQLTR